MRARPEQILEPSRSAKLCAELLDEIARSPDEESLALWAKRRLSDKNILSGKDAREVEAAYLSKLKKLQEGPPTAAQTVPAEVHHDVLAVGAATEVNDRTLSMEIASSLSKMSIVRNKAHLRFVALQPCLICRRTPSDPHHVKFAQPRMLGRKVSDEFTVPLCRSHHQELHRHGNERAWWVSAKVEPLQRAAELWEATTSGRVDMRPSGEWLLDEKTVV